MTALAHLEHREVAAVASARRTTGLPGIIDVHIAADHELIKVRSQLLGIDGLTFVEGVSTVRRDLVLHVREGSPALALHITLRGTATPHVGGKPGREIAERVHAGQWLVFGGEGTHHVFMQAGVSNAGLRINFTRSHLEGLAARYPEAFEGKLRRAIDGGEMTLLRSEPMALGAMLDLADELRASEHYGSLRALFLESTAHEMLVRALAGRSIETPRLTARARERMVEARAHLLGSMRAPLTLAALARAVGTNEFRLKRDFKQAFGEPVHAFLLRRRLEHGRALLLDGERLIKEIAAEVGYAHVAHFSAAFRKQFGVPPSALRPRPSGNRRPV